MSPAFRPVPAAARDYPRRRSRSAPTTAPPGYGGPCPPEGDHPHRYLFTVHAVGLDTLPVDANTSAAVVGFFLHFNTLEKAALMGLYKR